MLASRSCVLVPIVAGVLTGCAASRAADRDARALARAVARGDRAAVQDRVLPAVAGRIDHDELFKGGRNGIWASVLRGKAQVRAEALVIVGENQVVPAVGLEDGWRFTADPTDFYGQATPRQALSSLVLASRNGRYDVLIHLAPRRYRIGLSREDLKTAWTTGEQAEALAQARDRVAEHLGDPFVADDHEAVLELGDGAVARLEREGQVWVVVDF